jgi:hypothetical protein
MAAMSDFLENALLQAVFQNTSYTSPTSVYVALYTAAPSDSGGGTEVVGGSYARVQVLAANWTTSGTATRVTNDNVITFPTATADWGIVSHVGLFDALAGNLLFHGALDAPRTVNSADTFKIAAGSIGITLT